MGSFLIMGLFGLDHREPRQSVRPQHGLPVRPVDPLVLIFSGLTAWDTQAIKEMYYAERRL